MQATQGRIIFDVIQLLKKLTAEPIVVAIIIHPQRCNLIRVLTGWLEILGGLGLLISFRVPGLLPFAAGGLGLLMVFAIAARVRVGDGPLQMSPAFLLMAANGFLAVRAAEELLHP